jgi:3-methyl-2-oxobutanoate hydroxymethyltransferase
MIVADMPWGSYQVSPEQAYESASQLMAVGAQMVKLEGGAWLEPTVRFLAERGVPVCAHLGLTPQSVHTLGGYKVQGRGAAGDQLIADAKALQDAGAAVVLVELIPTPLGKRLEESLHVPTIGIGAGPHCDGQVLVINDMIGLTKGFKPRFLRQYLNLFDQINGAVQTYVKDVKSGEFPDEKEQY